MVTEHPDPCWQHIDNITSLEHAVANKKQVSREQPYGYFFDDTFYGRRILECFRDPSFEDLSISTKPAVFFKRKVQWLMNNLISIPQSD